MIHKSLWAGLGFAAAVSWSFAAESPTSGWVTAERLVAAHRDADNWLSVGRDYGETRFSPLTHIDADNVKRLGLAWFYDLDTHRGQEATPVVVDGVMYTSSAWSKVLAFKAATGELLWEFDPKVSGDVAIHVCCDLVNGKVWLSAPGALGAHNWQAAAFSPLTGLVYIPAQETPFPYMRDDKFERTALGMNVGLDMAATSLPPDAGARAAALAGLKGYLLAWDPVQQREAWRAEHAGPWNGGVLATAGNLVFQGTASGELVAYRASDGTKLWSDSVRTGIGAAPMTFAVGGRQYVSVLVGWGGVYPLVAGELAFKSGHMVNRSRVLTYALDGTAQLPEPPVTEPPAVTSVPAGARPEEQLVREGAKLYARHCGNCHGDAAVSGGIVPDLRYSHALTNDEFWTAVVHDGVLAARGMVSFKAELSASHEQALRAYLTQRALESRQP